MRQFNIARQFGFVKKPAALTLRALASAVERLSARNCKLSAYDIISQTAMHDARLLE